MGIREKEYDLLVLGEPMVQYIVKDKNVAMQNLQNPSVGGEDVFVAATAAKHGLSVAFYSAIAQDPYENLIKTTLKKHNINTDFCISSKDAFNGIEIVCDNDNDKREFFYNRPPGFFKSPISPNVNKELLDKCRMIYASSAFTLSSPEARSLVFESFHYAHHHEISVAFDPNLRLHRHNSTQLRETLWMLMPFIDFFSVSAASGEMQFMFASEDIPPEENYDTLSNDDKLFFRKRNMENRAWDLLEKNLQCAAIRNGAENMFVAYFDQNGNKKCDEIEIKSIDNGFLSYSGAVFNGALFSKILRGANPLEAAEYAAQFATQKCSLGNSLDTAFPKSI